MNDHEWIMHETEGWVRVLDALPEARLIAFDGCHKIYLALDEKEVQRFTQDDSAYETYTASPKDMYLRLRRWYNDSCDLRFISGIRDGDFLELIGQW